MPDLPKITERYLMTARWSRPFFSMKEMELLLEALRLARQYAIKFERAHDTGAESRKRAVAFCAAIDDFAEELTGDRSYFQAPPRENQGDGAA